MRRVRREDLGTVWLKTLEGWWVDGGGIWRSGVEEKALVSMFTILSYGFSTPQRDGRWRKRSSLERLRRIRTGFKLRK